MAKPVGKAKPNGTNATAVAWPADQVERWPIGRLIAFARNARTHSAAQVSQLAAAIHHYGWTAPVLVDEAGEIIAGHGRVLAAQQLDITEVPTMVARGWSEAKVRAFRIADNRLAELAGWDEELLGLEFADLRGLGEPLELTGFNAASIEDLIGAAEQLRRLPDLPNGERSPFQEMTFILHDEQVEAVKQAIGTAKAQGPFAGPNENSNGNALARICEAYAAA